MAVATLLLFKGFEGSKGSSGENSENQDLETEGTDEKVKKLTFPYELEDGKLELTSIFQFTGFNPDCNNEEGEDIAALSIVNQSEEHVKNAEIKVKLTDGRTLLFEIQDLPADASVMVFEKNNAGYGNTDECAEITGKASWEEETALAKEQLSIGVSGTTVTLTNISEEEVSNLLLHCHCKMDDSYFGGLTYQYPVERLQAGESISIEAEDCYLGEASVVRVSEDNKTE